MIKSQEKDKELREVMSRLHSHLGSNCFSTASFCFGLDSMGSGHAHVSVDAGASSGVSKSRTCGRLQPLKVVGHLEDLQMLWHAVNEVGTEETGSRPNSVAGRIAQNCGLRSARSWNERTRNRQSNRRLRHTKRDATQTWTSLKTVSFMKRQRPALRQSVQLPRFSNDIRLTIGINRAFRHKISPKRR